MRQITLIACAAILVGSLTGCFEDSKKEQAEDAIIQNRADEQAALERHNALMKTFMAPAPQKPLMTTEELRAFMATPSPPTGNPAPVGASGQGK